MSDEAGLLAAITDNPDDDTVRLAYADWLDEHLKPDVICDHCNGKPKQQFFHGATSTNWTRGGVNAGVTVYLCGSCNATGTVPDTTNRDRAEFIRVQVEYHRKFGYLGFDFDKVDWDNKHELKVPSETIIWGVDIQRLKARSAALLAAHQDEWLAVRCPECGGNGCGMLISSEGMGERGKSVFARCHSCKGIGDVGGLKLVLNNGDLRRPVVWERGFPHAVECSRLEDVLERPVYNAGHDTEAVGPWQPTPWARAVVTYHPTVREFRCRDREPYGTHPALGIGWQRQSVTERCHDEPQRYAIPDVVYDALEGGTREPHVVDCNMNYPTREAALTALWRALGRVVGAGVKGEQT
jgi:uncharacterized protein (TIGR02996 family)